MMVTLAISITPLITLPCTLPGTNGIKFTCGVWSEMIMCGGNIEGEVEGEGVWSEMMMCVRRDE